eukprot:TRINITY_DN47016_c0_g1_i1.p1 TRINITY_DN47016_c0_g1~~TRINITY_DN47016_c0_g1_i1.p1  ORF type:complete len:378 (+),score=91.14 TRINITY_DN47016_c0_g1_i1:55-1188(+)
MLRGLLLAALVPAAASEYTRWTQQVTHAPFPPRAIPAGGIHNGTFYVMGGRNWTTVLYNDVWKSDDGLRWEQVTKSAAWSPRAYMDSVVLSNGSMVLMGGQNAFECFSDVWRSDDFGKTWYLVTASAPWGVSDDGVTRGRSAYKTLVVNDTIIMVGGDYGAVVNRGFYPNVWVSSDYGRSWAVRYNASALDRRTRLSQWLPRAGMQLVRVNVSGGGNGTVFLMGGDNDEYAVAKYYRFNDIWRSDDLGATWQRVGDAPWGQRTGHQCVSVDDQCIHCIGGQGNPSCNGGLNTMWHDVWKSCDSARNWERVSNANFGCDPSLPCGGGFDKKRNCGKDDFLTRVKGKKIWMIAGDEETEYPFPMSNSVWTLEDDDQPAR